MLEFTQSRLLKFDSQKSKLSLLSATPWQTVYLSYSLTYLSIYMYMYLHISIYLLISQRSSLICVTIKLLTYFEGKMHEYFLQIVIYF